LNFLNNFSKNIQISNFMKIRPVEAELYHADRRTDGQEDRHDEANSGFSQFCERAPQKQQMQTSKYSIFLKLISLRPVYYIHITSFSTPYSQTQSAYFHLNDSSKFHNTSKGKTPASNICFFFMGRQNILN